MRNLRSVRGAKVAVAALALAMTAGACGSDREGTAVTGDTSGDETTSASGAAFGDLESPCGEGDASGATDQGVTDDSITIGYGDDRGFAASPGLSQEMGDAVKAMIDWCNEQGGINGRQIVGNQYDAAYTNAAAVMQESCQQDFMLVGQGFAYDEAAEQFRVGCNLPTVAGYTVGPNAAMGPMKYEPVPYPVDLYNAAPLMAAGELIPEFKTDMDVLTSNSPAVQAGNAKSIAALAEIGITPMDCGVSLSSEGDPTYVPFAEKVKDCGAQALFSNDSPDAGQFSLIEAFQRVGIDPALFYEATWYKETVAEWNAKSGAGDNLHVGLAFQPYENADVVPAVQDYLDVIEASGGKKGLLGMQATSAFLLWATVAKDCGSDLTRQCMIDGLEQVTEWSGGGLHATTNPGDAQPASCALVMKLTGGQWEQVFPAERGEFHCPEGAVVETDPATWGGVELNEDRVSTTFLTDKVLTPSA